MCIRDRTCTPGAHPRSAPQREASSRAQTGPRRCQGGPTRRQAWSPSGWPWHPTGVPPLRSGSVAKPGGH
eukprot:9433560-Alexandrium_andersonii.AAC.1